MPSNLQEAQTNNYNNPFSLPVAKQEVKAPLPLPLTSDKVRPLQECLKISRQTNGFAMLTDDEVVLLAEAKYVRPHMLEKVSIL
jgi:hypothetical protein